ncbi:unnamed protein product [Lepidochelys olivacea]
MEGFSTMSICQRPEGNMDLRGLGQQLSFLQPSLAHREEAVAYYSTNSLPWSLQDGHGSVANLPRGTTSVEDNGQTKRLSEELVDGYEGERLPLDTDDPDQSNFQ